jgi:hypothetical protein
MATISLYDHTRLRFANGANSASDTYRVKLFTAATFNATHTTETAAGGTEVAAANGYVANGVVLTGVTIAAVNTNEARFDANDATWNATGAGITASYARLYNDTDSGDPPVAFIDFNGPITAIADTQLKIIWDATGIVTFKVPQS